MKNIIILNGSPRPNGNTSALTAAFKRGAEEAGNKVTEFQLSRMKINGCLGCWRGGRDADHPCTQRDYNQLHFIQCACHFTDTCSSCRDDGVSVSKRMETKKLIAQLKKTNPFVESNIFKSVENVNLSTIIAYKKDGTVHRFTDTY